MKVAVFGVGAFGRNHARVYHQLTEEGLPVRLVGVVDRDQARAEAVAREFDCRAFKDIDELISAEKTLNAASVAVPTINHFAVARRLLESGIDVLIEKPLASTLTQADQLIEIAKRTDRVVQVGHLERFNPAVSATFPLITHPMFFEVHRLSVFTPRSLDVDVVLDLMIHDLDILLSFVNSSVKEVRAAGLPILSGKVDIANVRVEFESGCIANLTASRVSTERVRKLRFFQPRQYISIDYGRQDVLVFTVGEEVGAPATNPNIGVNKPVIAPEEPLHAELKSFIECVRTRANPLVSSGDGRRALELALEITSAIAEHHKIAKLDQLMRS